MPDILDASDAFDRDLLLHERQARRRFDAAYRRVEERIRTEAERLLRDAARVEEQGGDPKNRRWRADRLAQLTKALESDVARMTQEGEEIVTQSQEHGIVSGVEHSRELAALVQPAVEASWSTPDVGALRKLVGFMQNGSPLRDVFRRLGGDLTTNVAAILETGLIQGMNPRRMAGLAVREAGANRDHALLVYRTESMRAFRESTRESFQANSDVVQGWIWNAHLGTRTCAACIALHGTVFPNEEPMGTHPMCRCAMVPQVIWNGEVQTVLREPSGEDWFARQSEVFQREILGKAKFAAYRDGSIGLRDLIGVIETPEWGVTRFEQSLAKALLSKQNPSTQPNPLPEPQTIPQTPPESVTQGDRISQFQPDMDKFEGRVTIENFQEWRKTSDTIFGKKLYGKDYAAMFNLPDDATMVVSANSVTKSINVQIYHPNISRYAWRQIHLDEEGKIVVHNQFLALNDEAQGKGFGLEFFVRQVEGNAYYGIDRIETQAQGSFDDPQFNGYYTWARFGYDGYLSFLHHRRFDKLFSDGVTDIETWDGMRVSDFMKTAEGRDVWKQHGSTIELAFDLKEGSLSRQVLESYRAAREKRNAGQ